MPLDQETINQAGIGDKFDARIAGLEGRQGEILERSAERQGKIAEIAKSDEQLIAEKQKALAPHRETIAARAKDAPSGEVGEEPVPQYERPQMDPKDLHDTFGAILVASALVGVATRGAYSGIMGAMTGALEGFTKADLKMVEQSLKVFDTNLASIKERNSQRRRAAEDRWKKYANDLSGLKLQMELDAGKFDDPLVLHATQTKSLHEAQKLDDANMRAIDAMIARAQATQASMENARARQAEAAERLAMQQERLRLAKEKGPGRGVTPSSTDIKSAFEVIDSDERFLKMDFASKQRLSKYVASMAKSKTIAKEVEDYGEGLDVAIEELIASGRLTPGEKRPWYLPDKPATFGPGGEGAAAPAGAGGQADLKKQAEEAIAKGKDPAAVRQRYKELTGEELGGV